MKMKKLAAVHSVNRRKRKISSFFGFLRLMRDDESYLSELFLENAQTWSFKVAAMAKVSIIRTPGWAECTGIDIMYAIYGTFEMQIFYIAKDIVQNLQSCRYPFLVVHMISLFRCKHNMNNAKCVCSTVVNRNISYMRHAWSRFTQKEILSCDGLNVKKLQGASKCLRTAFRTHKGAHSNTSTQTLLSICSCQTYRRNSLASSKYVTIP